MCLDPRSSPACLPVIARRANLLLASCLPQQAHKKNKDAAASSQTTRPTLALALARARLVMIIMCAEEEAAAADKCCSSSPNIRDRTSSSESSSSVCTHNAQARTPPSKHNTHETHTHATSWCLELRFPDDLCCTGYHQQKWTNTLFIHTLKW